MQEETDGLANECTKEELHSQLGYMTEQIQKINNDVLEIADQEKRAYIDIELMVSKAIETRNSSEVCQKLYDHQELT